MSQFKNKVSLAGKVSSIKKGGQSPVMTKYTGQGKALSTFFLNVPFNKKKDGQSVSQNMFFVITTWGALAEEVGKLKDGDFVEVDGFLRHYSYEGQDGKKVYKTEIVANSVKTVQG